MNKRDTVEIIRETQESRIYTVMTYFKDAFNNTILEDEESRRKYARKIYDFGFVLSAYEESSIRGFICGYINQETKQLYVSFFAIDQSIKALKGAVLYKLVYKIIEYAIQRGMLDVKIEVDSDNEYLINLYKKIGLKITEKASDHSVYMEQALDKLNIKIREEPKED